MSRRRPPPMTVPKPTPVVMHDLVPGMSDVVDLDRRPLILDGVEYVCKRDDFNLITTIGRGQYGTVQSFLHKPSQKIIAIKTIPLQNDAVEMKRALKDLTITMSAKSQFCVAFYGFMIYDSSVWICMERMDISMDKFITVLGDRGCYFDAKPMRHMTYSVVHALRYLWHDLQVIHRDVKPSNILADRDGRVKICDYGVSAHLVNSLAYTQDAGCAPYMAPERIAGDKVKGYQIQSDVWSLGISLIEMATGKHPFPKFKNVFEQLNALVKGPSPKLPDISPSNQPWEADFVDFVNKCLIKILKEASERYNFDQLLEHPYLKDYIPDYPLMASYVCSVLDPPQNAGQEPPPFVEYTPSPNITPVPSPNVQRVQLPATEQSV